MRSLKVLSISILFITISFFVSGQATISQKPDISIVSVNMPDTVQIGETITIDGFIRNDGTQIINQDLLIVYDIEDVEPEDYEEDDETDEEEILEIGQLLPGDSISFSKNILINSERFIQNSQDVVIIWPETAGQRAGSDSSTNYNVNEMYVMEASVEVPINEEEEEEEEEEEDKTIF